MRISLSHIQRMDMARVHVVMRPALLAPGSLSAELHLSECAPEISPGRSATWPGAWTLGSIFAAESSGLASSFSACLGGWCD